MNIQKDLIKMCEKAFKRKEIPVSAVITYKGKILSRAYNKRNKSKNPLDHAEIICIIKAAKKLKNWRLNDCDLYVTLFPCKMCRSVIEESRIRNVYYVLSDRKNIINSSLYNELSVDKNTKNIINKYLVKIFEDKR